MDGRTSGAVEGAERRGAERSAEQPYAAQHRAGLRGADTGAALIVPLHRASLADAARVGAKAGRLGDLERAGLVVPEGLVLTAEARDRMLAASPAGPGRDDASTAPLPEEVRRAVALIARHFGDAAVAVRSSSALEDAVGSASAGRYATILGVRGADAIAEAVRRCWASSDVPSHGGASWPGGTTSPGRPAPFAVLVQRQVDARATGVAMTADPVTGAGAEVVVASSGDLAAVVDGRAPGDLWRVAGSRARCVAGPAAISVRDALAVASLARRVERIEGRPCDIEWALAGDRLLLLQARPMTAVPRPPEARLDPRRSWVRDRDRNPAGLTALGASVMPGIVSEGLTAAFRDNGALIRDVEMRVIGGCAYLSFSAGGHPGSPPPWWLLALLARVAPGMRAACRAARAAVDPAREAAVFRRWRQEVGPACDASAARLRAVAPARLDDAGAVRHLDDCIEAGRAAMRSHFAMTVPVAMRVHRFVRRCEAEGVDAVRAMAASAGGSPATTAPAVRMRAVVEAAPLAECAAVCAAGTALDRARLGGIAPALAAGFDDWCGTHGLLGMSDDPGSPCWGEHPEVLLRMLTAEARRRTTGTRSVAAADPAAARRGLLDAVAPDSRAEIERLLDEAVEAQATREDVAARTGGAHGGLVRRAALEIGARLVAAGALDRVEDAVELDHARLRCLVHGPAGDLREEVERARGERAWMRAHPGPDRVGPPERIPDLRGLPAAAREVNEALLRMSGAGAPAHPSPAAPEASPAPEAGRASEAGRAPEGRRAPGADRGPGLTGTPACAGRRRGRVRLIEDDRDLGRVRAGDVLVCRVTDPGWAPVFALAGALVCDGGGVLSHAAIVAREHGIPAVLATGTATRVLRDGWTVEVDGTHGRVDTVASATDEEDGS